MASPADGPPPSDGSPPPDDTRRGLPWRGLALATLAVVAVGFGAGWLFGRATPRRAASTLLTEVVTAEPSRGPAAGSPGAARPAAPSSGAATGRVRCGVRARPLSAADQVTTLAAGGIVVQYRAGALGGGAVDRLARLAPPDGAPLVVAPNARLQAAVTATAWRHRLPLGSVDLDLLGKFVTAYAGRGAPDRSVRPCP